MINYTIEATDVGLRLDSFLQQKLGDLSRSHIQKLIDNQNVLVDGKSVKNGFKLKENMVVSYIEEEPQTLDVLPENINIEIVYEDDDLAVINKQKGLVVHPANGNQNGTLVNALLYHLKNLSSINGVIRPGIVHRLDKDTSGLIIIAKNDKAHIDLAKQIETKSCHRYYLALCNGNFKDDEGVVKTGFARSLKDRKQMAVFPIGQGKYAETHYRVIERFNGYSLVEFKLQTGRTHQIRVHSKHLNHTIVGDEVYGFKDKNFKTNGQLLHAYKIEFTQPNTKQEICLQVDLPDEFKKALKKLNSQII